MSSNPHQITIEPVAGRVRVTLGDTTIADSPNALALREGGMGPVLYIPRGDILMESMQRTQHSTHCPFKGDASYYRLNIGDRVIDNIAWSYEDPRAEVDAIKEHLAFYPNKVDAIVTE